MKRVLALTFGDESQASTFFRVHQYIKPLASAGIRIDPIPARKFDDWRSVPSYDAVLVQKSLLPSGKTRRLRRLARRLVYDIDDAIWHPHGRKHFFLTNLRQNWRLRTVARSADLCVAANEVLARHLRCWTARVTVVPMALDEQQWVVREPRAMKVRIGWSGSPVNRRYVEAIEGALVEVESRFSHIEFAMFCGESPRFEHLKFIHIPYSPGREPETIRTFDIGLLPLPNDLFAAGKSPIKALQYMASGAAVVLSPVGAAAEMFVDGETAFFARDHREWSQALARLIEDAQLRQALAENARREFLKKFSLAANVPQVIAALIGSGESLPQFSVNAPGF